MAERCRDAGKHPRTLHGKDAATTDVEQVRPVAGPEFTGETPVLRSAFAHTDVGNAELLITRYGDELRQVPEWGKWVRWSDGLWKPDAGGDRCAIQAALGVARERLKEAGGWAYMAGTAMQTTGET